jgi:hypothetical protein
MRRMLEGHNTLTLATSSGGQPWAATVFYASVDNWNDVRGLQVEGDAARVEGAERARALALYLAKFLSVRNLFEAPRSADEQTIAKRLKNTDFWRVTPRYVRLIDNARGFGFKLELRP